MTIPLLIILALILSPALGESYTVELQNVTIFFKTPALQPVSISAKEENQFFAQVDRSGKNISIQVINVSTKGYKNTQRDSVKLWTELAGQIGLIEQMPGWIETDNGFSVDGDVKIQDGYGYVGMKTHDLDKDGLIDYATLFIRDIAGYIDIIVSMARSSYLESNHARY
jgi:hypothetical protein